MPDCTRVECAECLPLFRYFVNQQPAVLNEQQVITPDCPQGYDCGDRDGTYVIPPTTTIPDVGPNDPDIDPECDYDCDNEIFYNDFSGLRPQLSVTNDEVTATCQDVDPGSPGTESETVAAGVFTVAYADPSLFLQAKAEANLRAFDQAVFLLQEKINNGEKNCYEWVLQKAFTLVSGNTINFGDFTADSSMLVVPLEAGSPPNYWGWYQWHKVFGPFSVDVTITATVIGNHFLNSGTPPYTSANTCQLRSMFTWVDATAPPLTMSPTPVPGTTFIDESHDNRFNPAGNNPYSGTCVATVLAGNSIAFQINRWLLFRNIQGVSSDDVTIVVAPV